MNTLMDAFHLRNNGVGQDSSFWKPDLWRGILEWSVHSGLVWGTWTGKIIPAHSNTITGEQGLKENWYMTNQKNLMGILLHISHGSAGELCFEILLMRRVSLIKFGEVNVSYLLTYQTQRFELQITKKKKKCWLSIQKAFLNKLALLLHCFLDLP